VYWAAVLMDGWKGICNTIVITCKLYIQCTNKNYILLEEKTRIWVDYPWH